MMLEVNFNPFPTLYTDRLILRRITFSDAADFLTIRSNKDIMSAIDKTPIESIAEIESFIQTIEDNLNNLYLMELLLKHAGFLTLSAPNGA